MTSIDTIERRTAVDATTLRQVRTASSVLRRAASAEQILGVLTSTAQLVVPAVAVWAGRRAQPGAPLQEAVAVDPASDAVTPFDLAGWAPRLGEGLAWFEDGDHIVFPMSSGSAVGALALLAPFEALTAADRSVLAVLCDQASMALDLLGTRAIAEHTEALNRTLAQITASYTDADAVLQTVVRSTTKLLGTDAAFVMLADESGTQLAVRTAHGITSRRFFEATCPADELLPGAAIRTRQVVCVRDMHEHDQARLSKPEGLRSMMCAPMFLEDQLVGVLLTANREVREATPEGRRIMGALASAAAISIGNARLSAGRERSIAQLAELNRLLERTLAFQREVTGLVLEGRGMEAVVGALTAALGRAVLVLDRHCSVIHAVRPDGSHLSGVECPAMRAALEDLDGVCRTSLPSESGPVPVVMAALELAGERHAAVLVVEGDEPLDSTDLGIVESAVTAIGLELMRDRAATEAEARLTGGLFQSLLSGDDLDDATIARRAAYLGYELGGPNAVIAVQAEVGGASWLDACVRRTTRRREAPTPVFERDDTVYLVLSGEDATTDAVKRHARLIEQEVEIAGKAGRARVAFAGPHEGIGGIRVGVREASYTLQVLDVVGTRRVPTAFGDLGVWALLGRIGDRTELEAFAHGVLGPLVRHDADHHADLVQTLRELARHNYHYRSAAEALYAHPNTLRYRMSRITEMTGLDLADADDRLRVELSVRILDVLQPS